LPLFVVPGHGVRQEISSMPGQYHLSVDQTVEEARSVLDHGIPAVLLFGLPEAKILWGKKPIARPALCNRPCAPSSRRCPHW
jgi:delta-aminolevulinic acid dehydratase/porphobilinogen synthase